VLDWLLEEWRSINGAIDTLLKARVAAGRKKA
jgi:hypothetical protein